MSNPRGATSLEVSSFLGIPTSMSFIFTSLVIGFGISIPIVFFPGIGACILTSFAASAKAISLFMLKILFTFVPAFISISYCVTVGPTCTSTTLPDMPKSLNTLSSILLLDDMNSVEFTFPLFLLPTNKSIGGKRYSPSIIGVSSIITSSPIRGALVSTSFGLSL